MSNRTTLDESVGSARTPAGLGLVEKIAAAGAGLAGVLVGLMGLNVILDVLARSLVNEPLPATLDMVQYLWMPSLAILALGATELRGEQIRVTVLTDALSPLGAKVADIVSAVVTGGLMAWVTVLCWEQAWAAVEIGEKASVSGFPIWPGRILVAIGVTLLMVCLVARLWALFQADATRKEYGND